MIEHCKRPSGTERAWFDTYEAAFRFARDTPNVTYRGDVPSLCPKCGKFHLAPPETKSGELTPQDCQVLEDMGIGSNKRLDEHFRCAVCGSVQRDDIEFLILADGRICCSEHAGSKVVVDVNPKV
jgi:hypothetical protein